MPSADPTPPPNRSPSPPPPAPIPQTPGTRAKALNDLYTKTLNHTLKTISYENFAACFPNIAAQVPGSLKVMHGEMISRLRKFATDEFNLILQERSVISSLNSLESLLSTARTRLTENSQNASLENQSLPIPPHLLPPTDLITAHLTPHLTQQQSHLNAKLQTVQSQNASLFNEIKRQEEEIEGLLRGLVSVVDDLEGAVGEMDGVVEEGEGLGGEIRGVVGEIGGV